jgi:hypothetical protein
MCAINVGCAGAFRPDLASPSACGSRYRSGRSADWLKEPRQRPAVRREAEEDGGIG